MNVNALVWIDEPCSPRLTMRQRRPDARSDLTAAATDDVLASIRASVASRQSALTLGRRDISPSRSVWIQTFIESRRTNFGSRSWDSTIACTFGLVFPSRTNFESR